MQKKTLTISNKLGLHARAAARLVALTNKYPCKIELICKDRTVNGKSIMGVMMLAASIGSQIDIVTDGEDEITLLEELEKLIVNKFYENE